MAKLERVLGSTAACSSSLTADQTFGLVAYPAGSTIVMLNPRTSAQSHLANPPFSSKNQITAVALSHCGRYLASGEFGADPKVRVWEVLPQPRQLAEMKYHKLGITCVRFLDREAKRLVSVGNQHDKSVVVWDWRRQERLAENRLTSQVLAIDIAESGRVFVTVGVRHVKFWYVEETSSPPSSTSLTDRRGSDGVNTAAAALVAAEAKRRGSTSGTTTIAGNNKMTLQGRSAILAEHRNNTFVAVACCSGGGGPVVDATPSPLLRTFALTAAAPQLPPPRLVEFVDKKLVAIYELGGGGEVPHALTMDPSRRWLMVGFGGCGGGTGVVRLFDIRTQPQHSSSSKVGLKLEKDGEEGKEDGGEAVTTMMSLVFTLTRPASPTAIDDGDAHSSQVNNPASALAHHLLRDGSDNSPLAVADVHSLAYCPSQGLLTALYSDRSIAHWHLENFSPSSSTTSGIGATLLGEPSRFHTGPIFDLEVVAAASSNHPTTSTTLPIGSVITAGADDTVRIWVPTSSSSTVQQLQQEPYSLRRVLKVGAGGDHPNTATTNGESCQAGNDGGGGSGGGYGTAAMMMAADAMVLDSTAGVRCLRLSATGEHLACGCRNGNIVIFSIPTALLDITGSGGGGGDNTNTDYNDVDALAQSASHRLPLRLAEFEAHDGEVLCLEYSNPHVHGTRFNLLASGSRDRLVHLFDAGADYVHLAIIDDHSSSINSIKFIPAGGGGGAPQQSGPLEMVTCGTDKLIVIRQLEWAADAEKKGGGGGKGSTRTLRTRRVNAISSTQHGPNYIQLLGNSTTNSQRQKGDNLEAVTANEPTATTTASTSILAACQDRQLRSYATSNGRLQRTIKGTSCEEGTLTKFCLDPSQSFAATVCSDRYVYVVKLATGDCVAVLNGQSDSITAIAFTPDCRRLLVASYSGCLFVWRLSQQLTKRMLLAAPSGQGVEVETAEKGRASTPQQSSRKSPPSRHGEKKQSTPDNTKQHREESDFGSLNSLDILRSPSPSSSRVASQQNASTSHYPGGETCPSSSDDLDSGIGGREERGLGDKVSSRRGSHQLQQQRLQEKQQAQGVGKKAEAIGDSSAFASATAATVSLSPSSSPSPSSAFHLRRISTVGVVRRSNSNLAATAAGSSCGDLTHAQIGASTTTPTPRNEEAVFEEDSSTQHHQLHPSTYYEVEEEGIEEEEVAGLLGGDSLKQTMESNAHNGPRNTPTTGGTPQSSHLHPSHPPPTYESNLGSYVSSSRSMSSLRIPGHGNVGHHFHYVSPHRHPSMATKPLGQHQPRRRWNMPGSPSQNLQQQQQPQIQVQQPPNGVNYSKNPYQQLQNPYAATPPHLLQNHPAATAQQPMMPYPMAQHVQQQQPQLVGGYPNYSNAYQQGYGGKGITGISTSLSLNALRHALDSSSDGGKEMMYHDQTPPHPATLFSPILTSSPLSPQYPPPLNGDHIPPAMSSGRNSLSQRYYMQGGSGANSLTVAAEGGDRTLWSPAPVINNSATSSAAYLSVGGSATLPLRPRRRSSNLFHPNETGVEDNASEIAMVNGSGIGGGVGVQQQHFDYPPPPAGGKYSPAAAAPPIPARSTSLISKLRSANRGRRFSSVVPSTATTPPTPVPLGDEIPASRIDQAAMLGRPPHEPSPASTVASSSLLRSRSQSPSHLALQLAAAGSGTRDSSPASSSVLRNYQLRRDGSSTPTYSSRTNLRLSSVSGQGDQQQQRPSRVGRGMTAAALKEAQQAGLRSSILRSRSIGDLKANRVSAAAAAIAGQQIGQQQPTTELNSTFGGYPTNSTPAAAILSDSEETRGSGNLPGARGNNPFSSRQLAKSVQSLNAAGNAATALASLKAQYEMVATNSNTTGGGGGGGRLAQSIRDLKRNSNPNLADEQQIHQGGGEEGGEGVVDHGGNRGMEGNGMNGQAAVYSSERYYSPSSAAMRSAGSGSGYSSNSTPPQRVRGVQKKLQQAALQQQLYQKHDIAYTGMVSGTANQLLPHQMAGNVGANTTSTTTTSGESGTESESISTSNNRGGMTPAGAVASRRPPRSGPTQPNFFTTAATQPPRSASSVEPPLQQTRLHVLNHHHQRQVPATRRVGASYLTQRLAGDDGGPELTSPGEQADNSSTGSTGPSPVGHHHRSGVGADGDGIMGVDLCGGGGDGGGDGGKGSEASKKLSLHANECMKEMQLACDKLLGARQLIDSPDTSIPANERERLLQQVDKAINTFRKRLDAASALGVNQRNLSDLSATPSSGGAPNSAALPPSSRHSSISSAPLATIAEVEINKEFVTRNFTRLMQLLMELNVAQQHQQN